jgi:hypothetical protein
MLRIYVESKVLIIDDDARPIVGDALERRVDQLMSALGEVTSDGDLGARLDTGEVEFCLILEARSQSDAFEQVDRIIDHVMKKVGIPDADVAWQESTARLAQLIEA